jgi:hypothetical protein
MRRVGHWPLVLGLGILACGSSVPEPEYAPHPDDAYAEVPYPPPSAMAEIVPPQPDSDAVWVDGGWLWRSKYWIWDKGGWVVPPAGARFSRWAAVYRTDGSLLFAPGVWRDDRGRRLPPPKVIAPAASPPTELTPEPAAVP